ncbi:hypothetical protein [Micromonospora ureilytica]|uniref:hypothetical protein n=1 Tax=Micromonospora ureilytica TaxID=709868 RepID=UPI002E0E14B7|nr:hypothetical protein OHB55_22170 [Micromonospora ureilytica]
MIVDDVLVVRRGELTDEAWAVIALLLPEDVSRGASGRQSGDVRSWTESGRTLIPDQVSK